MLTSGDDYPIHQLPEPVAHAAGERNFYDRYFFNGYTRDGSLFFAAALGVYPQLGVMDAGFSVLSDGVQRNLRASRSSASLDRMATQVGPIEVEVIEPLRSLGLRVSSPRHGVAADLVFTARAKAVEEPRFVRRAAGRTLMDLTRMTQHGVWRGRLEVEGESLELDPASCWGSRDRSWGIRAVGEPDPQAVPGAERQFYWLWAPLNFEDRVTFFHRNEDGDGRPWTQFAAVVPAESQQRPTAESDALTFSRPRCTVQLRPGSRHAAAATLFFGVPDLAARGERENHRALPADDSRRFDPADPIDRLGDAGAGEISIELAPRLEFFMSGIGYLHPEWGHGRNRGELSVGYDAERVAEAACDDLLHLHVQALCDARMNLPDGSERRGQGVLEQLVLGRHAPSGLAG